MSTSTTGPRCPICSKPRSPQHRPFCSPRCADVDLQRWLSDSYAIPVTPDEDASDAQESAEGARQTERGLL